MGGNFSTPESSPLIYDHKARDAYNHKGMISCMNEVVYDRTMGILGDMGIAKAKVY